MRERLGSIARSAARRIWMRAGTTRRCFLGPYAGLRFHLGPQLYRDRMSIFYRAYEPDVASHLTASVQPGMIVYVVGAHVGIHVLHLAKLLAGRGRVFAFEPWPANFSGLEENVACNPVAATVAVPVEKAVGAVDGLGALTGGPIDGTHHLTDQTEVPSRAVEVVTLDSFSRSHPKPELLLVDTEGGELDVLRGARTLLEESRPQLVLEHHGGERRVELIAWLEQHGYAVEPLGPRHLQSTPIHTGADDRAQDLSGSRLLLLLPDGVAVRNFLCTSFVERWASSGQVTIWHALPERVLCDHQSQLGPNVSWRRLPIARDGLASRALRRAGTYAQLRLFQETGAEHLRVDRSSGFVTRVVDRAAWAGGRVAARSERSLAGLDRLYDVVTSSRLREWRDRLIAESPDVVFCANQRSVAAVAPVAAARQLGIPTATFVHSWDNLPKGRMAVRTDHYLVWSEKMGQDLLRYYSQIDPQAVHVVGTPQFEHYFDRDLVVDRADFLEPLGLDPARPVVCFSGDDVTSSPYDPQYLADAARSLRDMPPTGRPQLLFRRCPTDVTGRYDPVLDAYPEIAVSDPRWSHVDGSAWSEVVPSTEDAALLCNVVHHCDAVVNFGSTMAMDFAIVDKPAVFLAYEPERDHPSRWSVDRAYRLSHFRSVHTVQPVHWVRDRAELGPTILSALEHPDDRAAARRAWLDLELGQDPASAGERCVDALKAIAATRP